MENPGFVGFNLIVTYWRFLRWPITILLYFAISFATFGLGFVYILGVIVIAYLAIGADRSREAAGNDDFRGTCLFYRYGRRVGHTSFSIPLQAQWGSGDAARVAVELRNGIASTVALRLPEAADVLSPHIVKDCGAPSEGGKDLVRVRSISHRGSRLVHFLHYAPVAQSVTAHHFTFVRGTHRPFDEFRFAFFSPFSIWLWGLPWLQNRFSILSHLSMAVANSFDEIDLETLFEATTQVIADATLAVLEANGLLTEALQQVIVNNHYNSQRLDMRNASDIRLGAITNVAPAAAVM